MGVNTKSFDSASEMITFSRASGAYGFTKVSYGSELVTNGTFDTDVSGWSTFNAVISQENQALRITSGNASGNQSAYQVVSGLTVGAVYVASLEVLETTGGQTFRVGDGVAQSQYGYSSTNTLGVHQLIFTAQTASVYITSLIFDNVGDGRSFLVDNVSVKEVTYNSSAADATLQLTYHPENKPRIEYNLDGTAKGLLIEEARTNLLLNNSNLYSARISALKGFRVSTASVVPASTQLVVSFYLKPKSVSRKEIRVNTDAYTFPAIPTTGLPQGVWTRVETEVVTGTGGVQSFLDLEQLTETAPTYTQNSGIAPDGTLTATEITDGTYTYEIWGAQLEEGSFATSFIKNEGAASTRAVDLASIPVSKFGYNQSAGTLFVDFKTPDTAGTGGADALELGDSAVSTNRYLIRNGLAYYRTAGGVQVVITYTPSTNNQRAGFAVQSNDAVSVVNGSTIGTDNSVTLFSNPTILGIGARAYNLATEKLNGHIKSIQSYPRRLTDAQLHELTL